MLAAFAISACGSDAPASPRDNITEDGTYKVGVDVVAGDYAARVPEKGVDPTSCRWEIKTDDGIVVQDQSNLGGTLPDRVVTLIDGYRFTTDNCGMWLPA